MNCSKCAGSSSPKIKILDLTSGNRAIWFDKNHPLATYLDRREVVEPDILCDTTAIPDTVGTDFDLIVYDPPHMSCGPKSNMSKVYGYHTTHEILDGITGTSKEASRISKPNALMAFKWNTHDISLTRVFQCLGEWEPLFGHLTKNGPNSQTFWIMLKKREEEELKLTRKNTTRRQPSREPKIERLNRTSLVSFINAYLRPVDVGNLVKDSRPMSLNSNLFSTL